MKDKIIFGAATCHDCDTLVKKYTLNLLNLKITELGYTNKEVRWINNSTVQWEEINVREKTENEMEKDPYGYPVVLESAGLKTKQVN
jgi:hypothetical protein